jgi:hypothetical protein
VLTNIDRINLELGFCDNDKEMMIFNKKFKMYKTKKNSLSISALNTD